jgi:ketosteroid isomerase-like protein
MQASRRSILAAAAGASLASFGSAGATGVSAVAQAGSVTDNEVAELIQRSAESNAALMRGDIDRYSALITVTDDFTLMSPFGGTPTRGADLTSERWEAMGRFFRNGTLEQEVVQAYGSADMVVLAIIERARVEVGGLPAQDWPLRVTLVYRREGSEWRLVHRHADPLVKGINLKQAAALARGEAT